MRETRHLWIGNLADNIREERIAEHFKRYGKIDKVRFLPRRSGDAGQSACVAFMDIRSAQKAKSAVNVLGERELITDYFDPAARSTSGTADDVPRHGQQQHHRSNTSRRYESHRESAGVGEEKSGYGDRYNRDRQSSYDRNYQSSDIQAGGADNYDSDSRGRTEANVKVKSHSRSSNSSIKAVHEPSSKKHKTDPAIKITKKKSKKMKDEDIRLKSGTKKVKQKHLKERGRSPTVKHKKTSNASSSPAAGKRSSKHGGSSSAGRSSSSGSLSMSTSGSGRSSSTSSTSSSVSRNSSRTRTTTNSGSESSYEPEGPPAHQKLVAMCIKKLPVRPTVTSLRDGVFHEFKKYGKVKSVLIRGEGVDRYALVLFRTAAEANKAISHAKTKLLFGAAIEASIYEGEVSGQELEECGGIIDEFHPRASRTLFVGNLDKTVGYSDIQNIFIRFGEIVAIEIKKQHNIPQYAFLQYTDILSVIRAITKMDGEKLGRNTLKLGFGKTVISSCLWVDGVTDSFTENYLASCFQRYGPVKHVIIDRNRGQALVFYSQFDFAQNAMAKMRARILNGSRLKMDYASNELIDIFLKHMQTTGQSIKGLENIRQLMQPASSPPSSAIPGSGTSYSRSSVSQDARPYYDDRSQSSFVDEPYGSSDPNYRRSWRGRSRDRYQYPPEQSSRHVKRGYDESYERQEFYRERSPQTWEHDGYSDRRATVSSHYDQDYRQKDFDIRREPRGYNRKTNRSNAPYDEMFQGGGYRRDRGRDGDRERDVEPIRERDRMGEQYYSRASHSSPSHPRYVSRRSRSISPQPSVGQRDADTYSGERIATTSYRRRGRSGSRSPDFPAESLRRRNSMESKSSSHSGSRYTSRTGDVDMRENMTLLIDNEDKLSVSSPAGEEQVVEFGEKHKKLRVRKRVIEDSPGRELSDSSPKPHRRVAYKSSASGSEKAASRKKDDKRVVEEWPAGSPTFSDNRSRSGTPTRDENQDLIGEVIIKQPSSSKSSHRTVEKISRGKEETKQRYASERKDPNRPRDKDYRKEFTAVEDSRKDSHIKGKTGRSNSASLIQRVHSPSELERKGSVTYTKDFDYRKHSAVRSSKSSGDVMSKHSHKTSAKQDDAEKVKRSKQYTRGPRSVPEYGDETKNSPRSTSPASDQPRCRMSGGSKILKREYSPRPEDDDKPSSEKYQKTGDKSRPENEKHLKERGVTSSRSKERDDEREDVDERRSYSQKRRHSAGGSDNEEMNTKRERKSSTSEHSRHKSLSSSSSSQKHEAPMSIARQMFLQEEDGESGAESPMQIKDEKVNVPEENSQSLQKDESETSSKFEQEEKDSNHPSAEQSPTEEFTVAKLAVAQSLLPKRLPKSIPASKTPEISSPAEKKDKEKKDGNLTDLEKEKERLQQLLSKLDSEKHLDVKAAAEVADVVLQELTHKAKSKILASKSPKDAAKPKANMLKAENASVKPESSNIANLPDKVKAIETVDDVTFEEEVVVDTIEEVMEDEVIESEIEEVAVENFENEKNVAESVVDDNKPPDKPEIPIPVVSVVSEQKPQNIDHSQGYRKQMEAKKKELEHLEKKREHERKKLMRKQEKEKKKQLKRVQAMRGPSQSVISSVDDEDSDSALLKEVGNILNEETTSLIATQGDNKKNLEENIDNDIQQTESSQNTGENSEDKELSQSKDAGACNIMTESNCEIPEAKKSASGDCEGDHEHKKQNLDLEKPWPPDKPISPDDEKGKLASGHETKVDDAKAGTSGIQEMGSRNASVVGAKTVETSSGAAGKTVSPLTPGSVDPSPMVTPPQPMSKDPSPQSTGQGITPTGSIASSSLSQKSSRNTPATTPSTTRTPNFTTPSPASTSSTSSSKSQHKQHQSSKNTSIISSHRQSSSQMSVHPSKKPQSRSDPHAKNRSGHGSFDHKKKSGHHHQQHKTQSSNHHSSKVKVESSKMKQIVPISRRPMASITVGLDASPSKPLGKSELERLKIELESVKNQLNLEMSPSSLSPCSDDDTGCGKSPAQLLSPVSPVLRSPADSQAYKKTEGGTTTSNQPGVSPSSTPTLTDRLKLIGRVKKRTPGSASVVKTDATPVRNSEPKADEIRQSRIFRSSIFDQDSERLSHVRRQLEEEKKDEQNSVPFACGVPLFAGSKFLEKTPVINLPSSSGSINVAATSLLKEAPDSLKKSVSTMDNSMPAAVDPDVISRQPPLSSMSGPKNVYSLSSCELPATAERIAHDFAGKNCNTNTLNEKQDKPDLTSTIMPIPFLQEDILAGTTNSSLSTPSPSLPKNDIVPEVPDLSQTMKKSDNSSLQPISPFVTEPKQPETETIQKVEGQESVKSVDDERNLNLDAGTPVKDHARNTSQMDRVKDNVSIEVYTVPEVDDAVKKDDIETEEKSGMIKVEEAETATISDAVETTNPDQTSSENIIPDDTSDHYLGEIVGDMDVYAGSCMEVVETCAETVIAESNADVVMDASNNSQVVANVTIEKFEETSLKIKEKQTIDVKPFAPKDGDSISMKCDIEPDRDIKINKQDKNKLAEPKRNICDEKKIKEEKKDESDKMKQEIVEPKVTQSPVETSENPTSTDKEKSRLKSKSVEKHSKNLADKKEPSKDSVKKVKHSSKHKLDSKDNIISKSSGGLKKDNTSSSKKDQSSSKKPKHDISKQKSSKTEGRSNDDTESADKGKADKSKMKSHLFKDKDKASTKSSTMVGEEKLKVSKPESVPSPSKKIEPTFPAKDAVTNKKDSKKSSQNDSSSKESLFVPKLKDKERTSSKERKSGKDNKKEKKSTSEKTHSAKTESKKSKKVDEKKEKTVETSVEPTLKKNENTKFKKDVEESSAKSSGQASPAHGKMDVDEPIVEHVPLSQKYADKNRGDALSAKTKGNDKKGSVDNTSMSSKKKKKRKKGTEKDKDKTEESVKDELGGKEKFGNINTEKPDKKDLSLTEKVKKLSKSISDKSKLSLDSKSLSVEVSSERTGSHGSSTKHKSKKDGSRDKVSNLDSSKKKNIKPHLDLKPSHSLPAKPSKNEPNVSLNKKGTSKQVSSLKSTTKASFTSPASNTQSRYSMIYDTSSDSDSSLEPIHPKKYLKKDLETGKDEKSVSHTGKIHSENNDDEKRQSKRTYLSSSSSSSSLSDVVVPPPVMPCSSLVTETIKNETILPPGYDDDDDQLFDKDEKAYDKVDTVKKEESDSLRESSPVLMSKIKKKQLSKTWQTKKDTMDKVPKNDEIFSRRLGDTSNSDSSDPELVISMSSTDDSEDEVGSMSAWAKVDADASKEKVKEEGTRKSDYGLGFSSDSNSSNEDFSLGQTTADKKKNIGKPSKTPSKISDSSKLKTKDMTSRLKKKKTDLSSDSDRDTDDRREEITSRSTKDKKKDSKIPTSKESKKEADLFSDSDSDSEDRRDEITSRSTKDKKKDSKIPISKESKKTEHSKISKTTTKSKTIQPKSDSEFSSLSDDSDTEFTSKETNTKSKKGDVAKITQKPKDMFSSKKVPFSKATVDKTKSDSSIIKSSSKSHDKKEKLKMKSASLDKFPSGGRMKEGSSKPIADKTIEKHKTQHHKTESSRSPSKEKSKLVKETVQDHASDKHETKALSRKDHSHKLKHTGKNIAASKSSVSDISSKPPHKVSNESVSQKHTKKVKGEDKKVEKKPTESVGKGSKIDQKVEVDTKKIDSSKKTDATKQNKKKKSKKMHKKDEKSNNDSPKKSEKAITAHSKEEKDKVPVPEKSQPTVQQSSVNHPPAPKLSDIEQKALARSLFSSDSDDEDDIDNLNIDEDVSLPPDETLEKPDSRAKLIKPESTSPDNLIKKENIDTDVTYSEDSSLKMDNTFPKSKSASAKFPNLHHAHSHKLSSPKTSEKRRGSAESFLTTSTTDESDVEQRMAVQSAISSLDRDDDVGIHPEKSDVKKEIEAQDNMNDNLPPPFINTNIKQKDQNTEPASSLPTDFKERNLPQHSPSKSSNIKSDIAQETPSVSKKKKSKKDRSHRGEKGDHKSTKPHLPGYSLSKHGIPFSGKERREHIDKLKSSSHERDEEAVRSIMGLLDESSDADSYFSDVRPEDSTSHTSILGNQTPDSDRGRKRSLDSDISTGRCRSSAALPGLASDASFETLHEVEVKPEVIESKNVKVEESSDLIDTRTTAEENELAAAVSSIEALFGDFDNKQPTFEDYSSTASSTGYAEQQVVTQEKPPETDKASTTTQQESLSQDDLDKGSDEAALAASTLLLESNEEDDSSFYGYRGYQNENEISKTIVSNKQKTSMESKHSDDANTSKSENVVDIELPSIRTDVDIDPPFSTNPIVEKHPPMQSKTSRKRQRQSKGSTQAARSSSLESKSDLSISDTSASESELQSQEAVTDHLHHGKAAKQRKIESNPPSTNDTFEFDKNVKTQQKLNLSKPETTTRALPFVPSSVTTTLSSHHMPSSTTGHSVSSMSAAAPFVTVSSMPPTAGTRSSNTERSSASVKQPAVLPMHQQRRTSQDFDVPNITGGQIKRRSSSSSSSTVPSPAHSGSGSQLIPSTCSSSFGGMHMPQSSIYPSSNPSFLSQNIATIAPSKPQLSPIITQPNTSPRVISPQQTSPRFLHPSGPMLPQSHQTSPRTSYPSTTIHPGTMYNPSNTVRLSHPQMYYPQQKSPGHPVYITSVARPTMSHDKLIHTSPTTPGIPTYPQYAQRPSRPPQTGALPHTNITSMQSHYPSTGIIGSTGQQSASNNNIHSTALPLSSAAVTTSLITPPTREHQFAYQRMQGPQTVQQRIPETSQPAQHHVGVPTYPHKHHTLPHQPTVSNPQQSPQRAPTPQIMTTANRPELTPKSLPRPQITSHGIYQPHGYPMPAQISPQGFAQPPFPLPSPTRPSASTPQISPSSTIPSTTPQIQDKIRAGLQRIPSEPYLIKPSIPQHSAPTRSLAPPQIKVTESPGPQTTEKTEAPRPQSVNSTIPNTSQPVVQHSSQASPQPTYRKVEPGQQPHLPGQPGIPAQMFPHPMYYQQGLHALPGGYAGLSPYINQPYLLRPGLPPPTSVMHAQQRMMNQQQRLQLDKTLTQASSQQPTSLAQTPTRKEQKPPQTPLTKSSPTVRDQPHKLRPPLPIHQSVPLPQQLHPSTQASTHLPYGPPFSSTAPQQLRVEHGERIVRMPSDQSQIAMVEQHFRQSGVPTTPPHVNTSSSNHQTHSDKPRQLVPLKQDHPNLNPSLPPHVMYSQFSRSGLGISHPHGYPMPGGMRYPTSQSEQMWLRPGANFRPPSVPTNLPQHQPPYVSAADPNRTTPHLTSARSPHPSPRLPINQQLQRTPPPATTPKPSADQSDQVMDLFQRYPVIWQGLLALRNDSAAVQTHFICGDMALAQACLPKPDALQNETDKERNLAVLRIVQRMRLEPPQLEGVDKRMTANSDFCLLLALPCGRDETDVIRQQNALKQGFIDYLKQKQAAGIVNVQHAQPQNQVQYVLHVFPPCDFTTKHLQEHARDLLSNINDIQHIMIVIAAV